MTAVVGYPGFLLLFHFSGRRHFELAQAWIRGWAQILFPFFLMPLKVSGRQNYPKEPCVLVSNHFSQIDILVLLALLPPKYHILSKQEVARIPVVGGILKRLHMYFDRRDPQNRARIMFRMEEELKKGFSIVIFPEGSRNRGPELTRPFQRGAFDLAMRAQVPISVLTIVDTFERGPAALGFAAFPGRIRCVFGEAIAADEKSQDLVKSTMQAQLSKHYGDRLA
jgi:1-acyl-sn-glycerol-3-phosphate acyltransferase